MNERPALPQETVAALTRAGFSKYGVASLPLPKHYDAVFDSWLAAGLYGSMNWLTRAPRERGTGEAVMPGARCAVVLAAPNYPRATPGIPACGIGEARIADFALGDDYHFVLRAAAEPVEASLRAHFTGSEWRICIDSAPFFERAAAFVSGIGFIGRNGMLTDSDSPHGSCLFTVCLLGTVDLAPTGDAARTVEAEQARLCGDCRRCIEACPGGALRDARGFNASRCLSYLTIEKRTPLTLAEQALAGRRLFGCDVCRDVCPYNARPPLTPFERLREGTRVNAVVPSDMFAAENMGRGEFRRRFVGSPLLRAGLRKLRERAAFIMSLDEKEKGAQ